MKALTRHRISSALIMMLILASFTTACFSAVIIDAFEDGPFSLATDTSIGTSETQGNRGRGPEIILTNVLGGTRFVSISTDRRRTTVTATLTEDNSAVTLDTGSGPAGATSTGSILMKWNAEGLKLLDYRGILFTFTELTGNGRIHIGVNEHGHGSNSTRLNLTSAGDFFYPLTSVDVPNGSLESASSIQVLIEGATLDFGFTLDSIRVVPEPSTTAFLLISAVALLQQRRDRT